MLESYVLGLVDKYVAPFAVVDAEEVRSGVRKGEVKLQNVQLKPEAFHSLNMPLTVSRGSIGEVSVQVGLKCLRAQPSAIVLKDVEVVINPAGTLASASVRAERRKEAVARLLKEDEEARRARLRNSGEGMPPREQSFFYKLFGSSIDSLEIQVSPAPHCSPPCPPPRHGCFPTPPQRSLHPTVLHRGAPLVFL